MQTNWRFWATLIGFVAAVFASLIAVAALDSALPLLVVLGAGGFGAFHFRPTNRPVAMGLSWGCLISALGTVLLILIGLSRI